MALHFSHGLLKPLPGMPFFDAVGSTLALRRLEQTTSPVLVKQSGYSQAPANTISASSLRTQRRSIVLRSSIDWTHTDFTTSLI